MLVGNGFGDILAQVSDLGLDLFGFDARSFGVGHALLRNLSYLIDTLWDLIGFSTTFSFSHSPTKWAVGLIKASMSSGLPNEASASVMIIVLRLGSLCKASNALPPERMLCIDGMMLVAENPPLSATVQSVKVGMQVGKQI